MMSLISTGGAAKAKEAENCMLLEVMGRKKTDGS